MRFPVKQKQWSKMSPYDLRKTPTGIRTEGSSYLQLPASIE